MLPDRENQDLSYRQEYVYGDESNSGHENRIMIKFSVVLKVSGKCIFEDSFMKGGAGGNKMCSMEETGRLYNKK